MVGIKLVDDDVVLGDGIGYGISDGVISEAASVEERQSVGRTLFQARNARDKTDLNRISEELCIRPHFLAALEQDDFNKFPSACYAAGFLKNYAAYLGLNAGQIVAQYKKEFQGSAKKVDLVFLKGEEKHSNVRQMIISMMILSALVLYGVWYSTRGKDSLSLSSLPDISEVTSNILVAVTEEDQKDVFAELEPAEVKSPDYTKDPEEKESEYHLIQQANANSPVMGSEQVRLSARDDTWVRIVTADRKILVDRILLAGEEFYMAERKDMTLLTSNAGAVSIFVDDTAVAPLGEYGEIRDNISLNKHDLLMTISQLSR